MADQTNPAQVRLYVWAERVGLAALIVVLAMLTYLGVDLSLYIVALVIFRGLWWVLFRLPRPWWPGVPVDQPGGPSFRGTPRQVIVRALVYAAGLLVALTVIGWLAPVPPG